MSIAHLSDTTFQHWNIQIDEQKIVWAYLDKQGEAVNTLAEAVLAELEQIISVLEAETPHGFVLMSAKASGFAMGADIREFEAYTEAAEVAEKIAHGHALFNRLEALPCMTVAAIEGFCLGGGLELALCCDYRIAKATASTRIGLPEVRLGIYPGLGGSARLTRLIGGIKAMELMLSARMLRAPVAKQYGIVDELVGEHQSLYWTARRAINKRRRGRRSVLAKLTNSGVSRPLIARFLRKETAKKARKAHYPAPFVLIDNWVAHGGSFERMAQAEIDSVSTLMVSDTARGLRRVFRLSEQLKEQGKKVTTDVKRVHVIGAGVMGGDIAAWCTLQGMDVTLQDRELKFIEPALQRAEKLFKKRLKKKHKVVAALNRLRADVDGRGVQQADVVIEAIFEDADVKRALYQTIEPLMKSDAILATNTSAIPLEQLATCLAEPSRLIGLHFFNPVAQMPLVEVVQGEQSQQIVIDRGAAFCNQINKFPIVVKSSPGFLVNRALAPYMKAALELHQTGLSKEVIDEAALRFGMPMGPIELADVVGLDVCMHVMETLSDDLPAEAHAQLSQMISSGKLGKKSGEGFYQWQSGKAVKPEISNEQQDWDGLAAQLIQPMLATCQAALDEGVVSDAGLLDAGIVFGTGFAPFTGGPLHYQQQTVTHDESGRSA